MKRRILSQVLCRHDLCSSCATRIAILPIQHYRDTFAQCRGFATTTKISQDPARQVKDDNEDDFSMLKQNIGLAFPSRAKVTPAPSATNVEPSRHRDEALQTKPRNHMPVRRTQVGPKSSTSKDSLQARQRIQRDGSENYGWQNRQMQFPRNRQQLSESKERYVQGVPSSPSTEQSQNRISQGVSDSRTSFVRFTPMQPPHDDRDKQGEGFLARKQQHQQRGTYSDMTRDKWSDTRSPRNEVYYRSAEREGRREERKSISDTKTRSYRSLEDQTNKAPGPSIDAPAGSSFGGLEESEKRRNLRSDRRARRSDRLVDDNEDDASEQKQNVKNTRRNFDMDAQEAEEMLYGQGGRRQKKNKTKVAKSEAPLRPVLRLPEFIGVERLAQMLKVNVEAFLQKLEEEGFEGARYDHVLDSGTSAMFAELYGFEPLIAGQGSTSDLMARPLPEDVSDLPARPPVVTIMGHVDHGKTTILDFFRKSSVVTSEHGGITQHIGAFSVVMPATNRQITFLDTPGHAAFLEMRRRGANVTDIVVLVVAADDSVKPQTIEAIKHSLEANVQIIVAINKIDKPEADVERVKQDLTRHDIVVEDYGGDYQVIPVSGKTGKGMSDLEEAIVTLSDVNDYRAEVDGPVEGWVIESKVTIAGRVATVLVRRGTLRTGDCIVAGTTWARVRSLRNDAGALVDAAPPGTPVQVDGWRGDDPTAGLEVLQAADEDNAKKVVDLRLEQEENMKTAANMTSINNARSEEAEARAKVLAWEREQEWAKKSFGRRPKDNTGWVETEDSTGPKKIHFIVKADVAGSVEALVAAVSAIGNNEIVANIVHSGTGLLTESDVRMLATTGEQGYAISFNQSVDANVARLVEAAGLTLLDHNIIYKVTDNVKEILADHLPPVVTQRVLGEAEVGQVFEITVKRRKVKIAGCRVTNGTISRSNKVRVQRGTEIVFTGNLDSLKNVKKDVTEMRKGTECGMGFLEWEDFQEGDQVQCFEEHHEKRTLY